MKPTLQATFVSKLISSVAEMLCGAVQHGSYVFASRQSSHQGRQVSAAEQGAGRRGVKRRKGQPLQLETSAGH